MNYLEYYGLQQEPFSNAPVSKFFFNSAQHSKALLRLQYAAESMKGLALLVGDIGAGKTTLARRMLDQLPEDAYEAALLVIIHSGITAEWLLKRIATQLGVADPAEDKLTLLSQLYQRLVQIHESGKKAIVLIDEAQMLQTREIMEEFRGLLNLEVPGTKLLTFIFFGLPELEENLKLDEPLAQRVALRYHLDPLSEEATGNYIEHRLRLAGRQTPLFAPQAVSLIHHYSRGIPRLINTICDNGLFEGSLLKRDTIEADIVENIAADLGLAQQESAAERAARSADAQNVVKEAHKRSREMVAGRESATGTGAPAAPAASAAPQPAAQQPATTQLEQPAPGTTAAVPQVGAPVTLQQPAKHEEAKKTEEEDDEIDSILDQFGE